MSSPSPDLEFQLPPGSDRLRTRCESASGKVLLEARGSDGAWQEVGRIEVNKGSSPRVRFRWDWRLVGLGAAIVVYLSIRVIALPSFPIYFFGDEAIQTVLAADLVRDGFHGYNGEFLPTYFPNGGQYNLSLSVYIQILPYLMFDKSVWVTRGVPALLSLLAALSVALALRRVFGLERAWLGVLVLSTAPAWFLHSRTAFEASLAVSFYAVFLSAYLLYRVGQIRWLYIAVAAAGLAFYSYTPAQVVTCASAVLFFLTDLRYHWKNRVVVGKALALLVILALPYARQQLLYPGEELRHLVMLNSYWIAPIPLFSKLANAVNIYINGLNPLYWFLPHQIDLPRHTMYGWGHLLRWTLPFCLTGVILVFLQSLRGNPVQRALLLALLACPLGAVPVDLGITRVLFLVVPAALLTALGLEAAIQALARLRSWLERPLVGLVFLALGSSSLVLLLSALNDGPRWYHDYGLTGQQYGALQVFGAVREELASRPGRQIVLSPTWANSTDILARFFLPDPPPIQIASLRTYSETFTPFDPNTLFILPADEYKSIPRDLFSKVEVEKVLPYPDGRPGFYFTRLLYATDAQDYFVRRVAERAAPVEEAIQLGGQVVETRHSRLDMGALQDVFTGNPDALIRSESSNPLRIELRFPSPRRLSGLTLRVGGPQTFVRVQIQVRGQATPHAWELQLPETPQPRDAIFNFNESYEADQISIDVTNVVDPPDAHVHLWAVSLR